MGSEELIANLFRISQTESKIKRDVVKGENNANKAHSEIGKKVRKAIKSMGGTFSGRLTNTKHEFKTT